MINLKAIRNIMILTSFLFLPIHSERFLWIIKLKQRGMKGISEQIGFKIRHSLINSVQFISVLLYFNIVH